MDVDIITKVYKTLMDEEKTELMKKGLCFRCKKARHLSRDCPKKKGKNATSSTPATPSTSTATPKKMTAKELTAHIQSLTALLNNEEKKSFTTKPRKRVFNKENWIDACLSCFGHSLCISQYDHQYDLYFLIKKSESENVKTIALIDSRAGGKFINQKYAEQLGLPIQPLRKPIMA